MNGETRQGNGHGNGNGATNGQLQPSGDRQPAPAAVTMVVEPAPPQAIYLWNEVADGLDRNATGQFLLLGFLTLADLMMLILIRRAHFLMRKFAHIT
jgi:hypothetical protein